MPRSLVVKSPLCVLEVVCILVCVACGNGTQTSPSNLQTASPPTAGNVPTVSASIPTAASTSPATEPPTAVLPDCAPAVEQPFQLPAVFAPSIPVPVGLKWYRYVPLRFDPAHPEIQMVGIAPLSLAESDQYLRSGFSQAGYQVTQVDAEIDEKDAQFSGNGWTGSYRIKAIPGCASATTWTLRVLKI